MGKILQAFVSGQLYVESSWEKKTRHHQHLCDQSEKLQEKLEEKLNDEEKKLLAKLTDTISDEHYCEMMNKFERGYQLGVLMTMEVFLNQESFLGNDE